MPFSSVNLPAEEVLDVTSPHCVGPGPLRTLSGTKWSTDRGAPFEWQADGTFLHKGGARPCVPVDDTRVMTFVDNTRMDLLEFDKEFTTFDHWELRSQPKLVEVGKLAGLASK